MLRLAPLTLATPALAQRASAHICAVPRVDMAAPDVPLLPAGGEDTDDSPYAVGFLATPVQRRRPERHRRAPAAARLACHPRPTCRRLAWSILGRTASGQDADPSFVSGTLHRAVKRFVLVAVLLAMAPLLPVRIVEGVESLTRAVADAAEWHATGLAAALVRLATHGALMDEADFG